MRSQGRFFEEIPRSERLNLFSEFRSEDLEESMAEYEDEMRAFDSVKDLASAAEKAEEVKRLFKLDTWVNVYVDEIYQNKYAGLTLQSLKKLASKSLKSMYYLEESGSMTEDDLDDYKARGKLSWRTRMSSLQVTNSRHDFKKHFTYGFILMRWRRAREATWTHGISCWTTVKSMIVGMMILTSMRS